MKVFLTGGTGFIGQAIVRTMRGRGWEVHSLVRDATSALSCWLARKGCVLVPGDVTRAEGLVDGMNGMDVVMHSAGVYELGADVATCERMQQHLAGVMPPIAFGGDATFALVDVQALAEGLCLAAEKAPLGEDYIFNGEPITLKAMFEQFARYPGGMKVHLQLPRWFMRPLMLLLEPLQRAVGLPAVLSRDLVDLSRGHFNYSAAKAHRTMAWSHPDFEEMWDQIVLRERELMAQRRGLLNKLRHQSVVDDPAIATTK